jgi:hypothetical protein
MMNNVAMMVSTKQQGWSLIYVSEPLEVIGNKNRKKSCLLGAYEFVSSRVRLLGGVCGVVEGRKRVWTVDTPMKFLLLPSSGQESFYSRSRWLHLNLLCIQAAHWHAQKPSNRAPTCLVDLSST